VYFSDIEAFWSASGNEVFAMSWRVETDRVDKFMVLHVAMLLLNEMMTLIIAASAVFLINTS